MNTLTDFIINYGDVIKFDWPHWDGKAINNIISKHPGWRVYQPHKPGYNRFGLSVTSLDGQFGGPDLYSLREYNQMNSTNYNEGDFKVRTNIVEFLPDVKNLLDFFEPNLGRCHFLRLDKGGFFPPHRDNGAIVTVPTFRILVPINNFSTNDMKWIQNEGVLPLEIGQVYFINTTKLHSLFSFVDNCVMLVLNVTWTPQILTKMVHRVAGI